MLWLRWKTFSVVFVFERGQPRELVWRISTADAVGAFVAERIDVLTLAEWIESCGRTPCKGDPPDVFGRVRPPTRGDVFEGGLAEGEGGLLVGNLGDRAAIGLEADVWETSGCVRSAPHECLNRVLR